MPGPSTGNEFLDLVYKSGVQDEKKLDAYLQRMRAAIIGTTKHTGMPSSVKIER